MATHARTKLPPEERKQSYNEWTVDERDLLQQFFDVAWTPLTLFKKLHKLNPQRTYESMSRELRRMKGKGWVRPADRALDSLRVGYLDIETTNLVADFGIILCWYIKPRGIDKYDSACVTKKELFALQSDRRVVDLLIKALDNYDCLYVHYGADRRFDIPFIRTRALFWGWGDRIPKVHDKYIFDSWLIAKNKLRLHSNRLDSIAELVGIEDVTKTRLSAKIWNKARYGDSKALEYICDHCQKDVAILERVHEKLIAVERPIYRSI